MLTIIPNLNKVINDLETAINDMDKNIENVKNFKRPMPHDRYDRLFDQTTNNNNIMENYKLKTQKIINLLDQYQAKNNDLNKELNNNKFKFGLQGQLKQQIKSQQDITSLPPHIQDIVNSPIVPTPFENRGGKKRRKTRKNRRTRK